MLVCGAVHFPFCCALQGCMDGRVCVCVCVWWEVGHRWDYTVACSFLSPLHPPLFLSMRSLPKGGPSVPGFLFNSAFMGCLLSACSTLCHGSGGSWVLVKGSE
ncbi:unnamed protein product [Rangifer tarandus platyrhynchus]|uniref:Uncharacterized protein n=2 Tax=Rangifer tarandus platyrhynchus TaxID=3082113 RepID=A0AC59Y2J9_RANTA|nr:unnamed protein product [Rangifer tarandus platyrhynchus]